uniref:Uncharacterized protein n=1 Tax=Pyrodinium bahamense TaxID=73915 RepID=A0A7S0BA50_9DINO
MALPQSLNMVEREIPAEGRAKAAKQLAAPAAVGLGRKAPRSSVEEADEEDLELESAEEEEEEDVAGKAEAVEVEEVEDEEEAQAIKRPAAVPPKKRPKVGEAKGAEPGLTRAVQRRSVRSREAARKKKPAAVTILVATDEEDFDEVTEAMLQPAEIAPQEPGPQAQATGEVAATEGAAASGGEGEAAGEVEQSQSGSKLAPPVQHVAEPVSLALTPEPMQEAKRIKIYLRLGGVTYLGSVAAAATRPTASTPKRRRSREQTIPGTKGTLADTAVLEKELEETTKGVAKKKRASGRRKTKAEIAAELRKKPASGAVLKRPAAAQAPLTKPSRSGVRRPGMQRSRVQRSGVRRKG